MYEGKSVTANNLLFPIILLPYPEDRRSFFCIIYDLFMKISMNIIVFNFESFFCFDGL